MNKNIEFNVELSKGCARTFSKAVGLGTVVSLSDGKIVASFGEYNCGNCMLCKLLNKQESVCIETHIYAMDAAERFGGRYVYFCPVGLACFTSPIIGTDSLVAKVTCGPFLMFDRDDFICEDLLPQIEKNESRENIEREISKIPTIPAKDVEDISNLMAMSVGFVNNVWAANNLLNVQESYLLQKQISTYISSLKKEKEIPPYPIELESELLDCIARLDRDSANKTLNKLLGYIFFSIGGDFSLAKSRIYELLVLISRTAINHGAESNVMLQMSHDYLQIIPQISSMEELSAWLAKAMNRFMDYLFGYSDAKHADIIFKAMHYIREHFSEKISLEDVAKYVYLSPTYFSRIFRQETGETFNSYLNKIRIDYSKKLLLDPAIKLIDVSLMSGFDDQSYFTKVFKRNVGVSPMQYRKKNFTGFIEKVKK